MSDYMTKLGTSPFYDQGKKLLSKLLDNLLKSGPLKRRIDKSLDHIRDIILDNKVGVIFEEFGFNYLGPIDGHNIPMLMAAIKYAKSYKGSIMLHIITQKEKDTNLPSKIQLPIMEFLRKNHLQQLKSL